MSVLELAWKKQGVSHSSTSSPSSLIRGWFSSSRASFLEFLPNKALVISTFRPTGWPLLTTTRYELNSECRASTLVISFTPFSANIVAPGNQSLGLFSNVGVTPKN